MSECDKPLIGLKTSELLVEGLQYLVPRRGKAKVTIRDSGIGILLVGTNFGSRKSLIVISRKYSEELVSLAYLVI